MLIPRPLKYVLCLAVFWLNSFVSAKLVYVFLGMYSRTPGLFDYFKFFYFYPDNPSIITTAVIAGTITYGGTGCLLFVAWFLGIANKGIDKLHGESKFATLREIKTIGLFEEDPRNIILGEVGGRLLRAGGLTPLILVAPTRSGKGVGPIITNLISWPDSVVAYDPKLELYQTVSAYRQNKGHDVFMFAPGMPFTHRYNPFDMWNKEDPQLFDYASLIANILSPTPEDAKDPIWTVEARKYLIGVIFALYDIGDYVSLPKVSQWVDQHQPMGAAEDGNYPQGSLQCFLIEYKDILSDIAYDNLLSFSEIPGQTRGGIRSQLSSALAVFQSPSVAHAFSGSDFDLRTLRKKRQSIFVGSSKRTLLTSRGSLSLFFQLMVNLLTEELPQHDEPYHVLALFDEFAGLGRLEVIKRALSDVAGYNIRIFIVVQNLEQLSNPKIYGRDGLGEIMGNMGHQIYYRPTTQESAEALSKRLGQNTVKAVSSSRPTFFGAGGYSNTASDQKRELMLPQEILKMDEKKAIVSVPGHSSVLCDKLTYFTDSRFNKRYFNIKDPEATQEFRPIDVPMVPAFRIKLGDIDSYTYWFDGLGQLKAEAGFLEEVSEVAIPVTAEPLPSMAAPVKTSIEQVGSSTMTDSDLKSYVSTYLTEYDEDDTDAGEMTVRQARQRVKAAEGEDVFQAESMFAENINQIDLSHPTVVTLNDGE